MLGGSSEAVQHALLVRQWSPDIVLFPHTDTVGPAERERLTARGIRVVEGAVARLVVDDDRLQGVELADGSVIPRTAVFVRPRFVPNADLVDEDVKRALADHRAGHPAPAPTLPTPEPALKWQRNL